MLRMKRAVLAVVVLAPMIAAVYACSTDTFSGSDGGDGGDGGVISQSDFCAAEAIYLHQCVPDDACAQADLQNCGAVYSAYQPSFLTALAHCVQIGQAPCTGDVGKLLSSPCMTEALAGYSNDSGALASFAQDYCKTCNGGSGGCVDQFAQPKGAGYIASFFVDGVIQKMDACEKLLDGGKLTLGDASLSCDEQTALCEYEVATNSLPASAACNDH